MNKTNVDVLVSGGGIAGLIAAVSFGAIGFSVLCVDPMPVNDDAPRDLRSTAFWQPAVAHLGDVGLWDRFAPHAAALHVMRIIDAGGVENTPRIMRDFNASDITDGPFGWNVPNWILRRELTTHVAGMDNVTLMNGVGSKRILTREGEAIATLDNGDMVRAKLLIGADGRNSTVREALDIDAKTIRYGQKATVFAVSHPLPHDNVSTEIHRTGGPFTVVPLPTRDGTHHSAIVWMETGPEVLRLADLDDAAFTTEMNNRSCGILGELTLASGRAHWPIISQIAERLTGERTALIAEAAHVVPPIGAQGLNMSLADLSALWELALANPTDIGGRTMLAAYEKQRHSDIRNRVMGIDMLNRASMMGAPALRNLRAGALNAMYAVTPVRKTLMRRGLNV